MPQSQFAVGSLVKSRGREWVVLPPSDDPGLLMVRPLSGIDEESTGILLSLESVEPARFALPDPSQLGDHRSCRLLRDAVRLGFRSSSGPFRSFAQIAVEPRPYQLVPLLMALKLDPVRLLIADDVGIGKTVEALLVARELLDRGEVRRMAVLCPPHLAEQWQVELRDKFHIDAEVVLPSTARRLERGCSTTQSLFDIHPFVVVSMDYVKSASHRDDFIRACPELVIVDEAHSCAFGAGSRGGHHLRWQLLQKLAEDENRHLILVTATPHSGNEDAFRSLLNFLRKDFANLPPDLSGQANEANRRRLAAHFIQRRRADIRHYMQADTPFPDRLEAEDTYKLHPDYKKLFDRILDYARETVREAGTMTRHRRVKWWSVLALLRAFASSPAAAAATLRTRAATIEADSPEEADEIGRRAVLDLEEGEEVERMDFTPGADDSELASESEAQRVRRRLLDMARDADALAGPAKDAKLQKAVKILKELIREGFRPIVFCRFIHTAEYLAEHLRVAMPKAVEIASVTGLLPPAEREKRVLALADSPQRVLVCTDCLSEGINLQEHFDAVVHYDLSWNPTRHEQREGRVDRFNQPTTKVRVLTLYGIDNQIDGIVLDILLRKHKTIRSSLGISVPVPADTSQVIEAIFEGLLLRSDAGRQDHVNARMDDLFGFDFMEDEKQRLHKEWENASERERRSRTMFAQETIKVDAVATELNAVRAAIGIGTDVARFAREALPLHRAVLVEQRGGLTIDLRESPRALRDALTNGATVDKAVLKARFDLPVEDGVLYLYRTHPVIEKLATHVMDSALDPISAPDAVARRAGVIRTRAVQRRTTLLLVRFRFHIVTERPDATTTLLAEDCQILAFEGAPDKAQWLETAAAEALLDAEPSGNTAPEQAAQFIGKVIEEFERIHYHLENAALIRADQLLDAHQRVRQAARMKDVRCHVEPKLPPDVLGIYVYLPAQEVR